MIEYAKSQGLNPGVYTLDDPREAYKFVYKYGIRYCVSNMKLFE
ncbi:MAG: hypothetical protein ACOX4I_03245 [Anaerovoracaceae bacterium]